MRVSYDVAAAEHVQKYIDGHDLSKEFDESVDLHTKVCLLQLSQRYQFSPAHLRHPGLKHCFFDLGEELEGGGRDVNIFLLCPSLVSVTVFKFHRRNFRSLAMTYEIHKKNYISIFVIMLYVYMYYFSEW